jgi:ankyrin repeat protein
MPLLHLAAWMGGGALTQILLDQGADAGSKSADGMLPLHVAGDRTAVEALLSAGTPVDAKSDEGSTALHYAAADLGSLDVLDALLARGANPHVRDVRGRTPLFLAAATVPLLFHRPEVEEGLVAKVESLLRGGADLEAPTPDGWTPLHRAVHMGRVKVVRVLLQAGADPTRTTAAGATAFELADRPVHEGWGDPSPELHAWKRRRA